MGLYPYGTRANEMRGDDRHHGQITPLHAFGRGTGVKLYGTLPTRLSSSTRVLAANGANLMFWNGTAWKTVTVA